MQESVKRNSVFMMLNNNEESWAGYFKHIPSSIKGAILLFWGKLQEHLAKKKKKI